MGRTLFLAFAVVALFAGMTVLQSTALTAKNNHQKMVAQTTLSDAAYLAASNLQTQIDNALASGSTIAAPPTQLTVLNQSVDGSNATATATLTSNRDNNIGSTAVMRSISNAQVATVNGSPVVNDVVYTLRVQAGNNATTALVSGVLLGTQPATTAIEGIAFESASLGGESIGALDTLCQTTSTVSCLTSTASSTTAIAADKGCDDTAANGSLTVVSICSPVALPSAQPTPINNFAQAQTGDGAN